MTIFPFPHGLYLNLSLGPKRPNVLIFAKAAICINPESFPINKLQCFIILNISIRLDLPNKSII